MMTEAGFRNRRSGSLTLFAMLAAVSLTVAALAQAQAEPVRANPLTERHAFIDDVELRITLTADGLPAQVVEIEDASRIAVVEYTIEPGFRFPWHTHPGSVLVSVTQGELVYIHATDCEERPYPAGTAFVDPGFDNVHMAFASQGDSETVILATFIGVPEERALTQPVSEEEAAALDDKCGIDR
jgi:quercetin dioxygenase-like cupin family protein